MIRISWFLLFLFLSFPVTGCYSQQQKTIDKPEASDSYNFDFGKVKEGEVVKHTFVLKNKSQKTLTIKELNTSCGCTVSKVKKKTLLSGESTLIEVELNTKGYSGPMQQYVYVHTDNLDNPVIRYIIKAEVVK